MRNPFQQQYAEFLGRQWWRLVGLELLSLRDPKWDMPICCLSYSMPLERRFFTEASTFDSN